MDSVRVAIRVRPLVKSELDRGCSNCVLSDSVNQQIVVNNNANQTFTFNYVFTPEHSQTQVYNLAVQDLVQKLFSGKKMFTLILKNLLYLLTFMLLKTNKYLI